MAPGFEPKKRRLKLPAAAAAPSTPVHDVTVEGVGEAKRRILEKTSDERKMCTQAAIVRLLKARKQVRRKMYEQSRIETDGKGRRLFPGACRVGATCGAGCRSDVAARFTVPVWFCIIANVGRLDQNIDARKWPAFY